ncbi:hypothetical protein HDU98_007685 [Podochytrium sp. JEL0797]|nr:hypothetical protein HDU98_007685 [Podochytrium sp. JEL0797]
MARGLQANSDLWVIHTTPAKPATRKRKAAETSEEAAARKAEQNRIAQQRFRERKDLKIKELELKVQLLSDNNGTNTQLLLKIQALESRMGELESENTCLKELLARQPAFSPSSPIMNTNDTCLPPLCVPRFMTPGYQLPLSWASAPIHLPSIRTVSPNVPYSVPQIPSPVSSPRTTPATRLPLALPQPAANLPNPLPPQSPEDPSAKRCIKRQPTLWNAGHCKIAIVLKSKSEAWQVPMGYEKRQQHYPQQHHPQVLAYAPYHQNALPHPIATPHTLPSQPAYAPSTDPNPPSPHSDGMPPRFKAEEQDRLPSPNSIQSVSPGTLYSPTSGGDADAAPVDASGASDSGSSQRSYLDVII